MTDMLFVGPNDLAFSVLGYTPAKGDEEAFRVAIDKVISAARRHEKKVGILVSTGSQAKDAGKKFDFVAIGGDVKAISYWFEAQLQDARG